MDIPNTFLYSSVYHKSLELQNRSTSTPHPTTPYPIRMEHVPRELVDEFIDELKDDDQSLRVRSLISRCWVDRSRHHLF